MLVKPYYKSIKLKKRIMLSLKLLKITKVYKIHSLFCCLLFICTGCGPVESPKKVEQAFKCIEQQSQCRVKTAQGDFVISFNVNKITPEAPFEISVSYHGLLTLSKLSGYMEGKDMFMGKVPLFFNEAEHSTSFIAESMLGSCSESHMVWRLWLTATFSQNELANNEKQTFFIELISSRG